MTNASADQLIGRLSTHQREIAVLLNAALQAERRATVDRIRAAIEQDWVSFGEEWTTEGTEPGTRVPLIRAASLHRILEAEARR